MEVLAKLGFDWHIALINFFNFLIIIFIVKKYVLPKIQGILEERQKKIDKSINDAEQIEKDIKKTKNQQREIIDKARKEASDIVSKSKQLANEIKDEVEQQSKAEGRGIIEKAQREAKKEKQNILNSIQGDISKIATLSSEKILNKQ